jgi:hypothetical protein
MTAFSLSLNLHYCFPLQCVLTAINVTTCKCMRNHKMKWFGSKLSPEFIGRWNNDRNPCIMNEKWLSIRESLKCSCDMEK